MVQSVKKICLQKKKKICLQHRRPRFNPWVEKIPCRRKRRLTPVFLPGKPHGKRSLAGYSPWGCKESNVTQQLNHHQCFKAWRTDPILGVPCW